MDNELMEYFKKKYSEENFTISPNHIPEFKSKKEIDEWIKPQFSN